MSWHAKTKGNCESSCLLFWVPAARGGLHPSALECSGRRSRPSAEVLPAAKRSNAAKAARPRRAVGQDLRQLIQNFKYLDCSDLPKKKHLHSRCFFFWYPGFFKMLGRNEFALRRGFTCGKTLERRKSGAAQKDRWTRFKIADSKFKYLDCSDLPQSRYNLDILGRTPRVSRDSDFFYCSKSVVCSIDIFQ